jgi:hypothetical protein
MLLKLKNLTGRISQELGAVSKLDLFAEDLFAEGRVAARLESRLSPDWETWTNTFGVEAGP